MSRILLTGAAGNLGIVLREKLKRWEATVRLSDIAAMAPACDGEEVVQCDLAHSEAVHELVKDCDAIIHLGGISTENTFDNILDSNIRGTYHIYEAARKQGVKRILFASSNHVIGFHKRETCLDSEASMRPDSIYGVSKGFGELLARYYFDKFGLETVSVRIGSSFASPRDRRMLATWLSFDDLGELVKQVFLVDRVGYTVVYGVSDNPEKWWDNRLSSYIGWHPKDSSEQFAADPMFSKANDPNDASVKFQGGAFAAAGHFEDDD